MINADINAGRYIPGEGAVPPQQTGEAGPVTALMDALRPQPATSKLGAAGADFWAQPEGAEREQWGVQSKPVASGQAASILVRRPAEKFVRSSWVFGGDSQACLR